MRLVLASLSRQRAEWRHGYDVLKETGLSSGTLYPLLMRMTDNGLVEAEWREPAQLGRPPRHVYRLTADGFTLALKLAAEDGASPGKPVLA
ncbi:PadR family transcriptional regulator [Sphingomonas phyllosphaerae]|uniref:PadR family transcriptional regulator n=1 Tax=Sphingomonas phyllosphaerae TaxID=257003 RepID=UPI0004138E78|nr:PadR family transcriptional regulator [Sphingomonas phyllosphaerae]